ncbi:MAG TPA: hypothetical protein VGI72_06225 [Gaiellales bacterium]|jgi:hypothetical protein
MADWVTISALATAGGTLVLAVATFSSVRSANRSARVAERSLMAGIRPVLMHSHLEDPPIKVGFADNHWMMVPGGSGAGDVTPEAVYVAMSLRNVGNGIAVLHGWRFWAERQTGSDAVPPRLEEFNRLTRDIYIPVGDVGFWQGVFRDAASDAFGEAAGAIERRDAVTIDVLYGDHEGGQRAITRFGMSPRSDGEGWIVAAARHWNVDRNDPR